MSILCVVNCKLSDESIISDQTANQMHNIGFDGSHIFPASPDFLDSRSESVANPSNGPIFVRFHSLYDDLLLPNRPTANPGRS